MARLLNKFFAWRRRPPLAVPSPAPWTRTDMERWGLFLRSDTGRKLLERMRAMEAANAIAGAKDVLHTSHAAGRSVGYGDALEHMISLSSSCDAPREKTTGAPGVAPAGETKAQAEARELAELLERVSP